MFSWLSNKLGLSKKPSPPPKPTEPKLVTIFDSVSYLSPNGEKTSPIDLEPKPKPKKRNPKSWSKQTRVDNQKSIVRASARLRNDVATTLELHTPKSLTPIVSIKKGSNSNGTKSILKKRERQTAGSNKTKKIQKRK
jgi:hypothetical protein